MAQDKHGATLHLRGVPEAVVRESKARAARRGMTLTAYVTEILARAAGVDDDPSPADGGLAADRAWYLQNRDRLAEHHEGSYPRRGRPAGRRPRPGVRGPGAARARSLRRATGADAQVRLWRARGHAAVAAELTEVIALGTETLLGRNLLNAFVITLDGSHRRVTVARA